MDLETVRFTSGRLSMGILIITFRASGYIYSRYRICRVYITPKNEAPETVHNHSWTGPLLPSSSLHNTREGKQAEYALTKWETSIPDRACTSTRNSLLPDFRGLHSFPRYVISALATDYSTHEAENEYIQVKDGTHKSAHANPVRMDLAARRTLHLEGVVVRRLGCIFGAEVGDSVVLRC